MSEHQLEPEHQLDEDDAELLCAWAHDVVISPTSASVLTGAAAAAHGRRLLLAAGVDVDTL